MIWGSPRRQYTWLAVGARTFALLSLAMPLILSQQPARCCWPCWPSAPSGRPSRPASCSSSRRTLLLVLDAALVGSVAGPRRRTRPPPSSARSPSRRSPPGSARGTRGVALVAVGRAHDVRRGRPVRRRPSTQAQGSAAFTWAITGLGLGLIASFVRTQLPRRHRPAARLPRRPGADPRADRPVRPAELRPRPGRPRRPDRERRARRAARWPR